MVDWTKKTTTVKKTTTTKKVAVKKVAAPKKIVAKKVYTPKTVVKKSPIVKKTVAKKVATPKTVVKKTVAAKKTVTKKITTKVSNNFIKNTFLDISLLYKNFFHWIFSKLLIFIWSIIIWFIAIIPFILLFLTYASLSDINVNMLISGLFNGMLWYDLYGNIILLTIVAIYFIVFSYSNILLLNLNNSYLDWKKISFKNNDYFSLKKIVKFFNMSLLNTLILLIPILIFIILIVILFLISGGVNNVNQLVASWIYNYFTILSFSFLVTSWLLFIYMYYRIVFSYFIFSDKKYYDESKSALSYIKESFNKTKKFKGFLKITLLIVIVIIITLPFNYIGQIIDNNWKLLNDYKISMNLTDEQKNSISSEDLYYYESLKTEFSGLSEVQITKKIYQNYIYVTLFSIFNFIFLYWLFVMIFSSFYKRELN